MERARTNSLRAGPAPQNLNHLPNLRAHLVRRLAQLTAINPTHANKFRRLFNAITWD